LCKQLLKADPRIKIIITGTKNESFLGRAFTRALPDTINLIGKTTIAQLFSLFHRVNLFISHDCGVMHVAAATPVAMVGLFGSTDPDYTGPFPQKNNQRIIQNETMAGITVSQVAHAALSVLADCPAPN